MFVFFGTQFSFAYTFNNDLRIYSTGNDVVNLQDFLESKGFLTMPAGVAKGYFGLRTSNALMMYQKSINLPSFGFFGPLTRKYINEHNDDNNASPLKITSPNGGEKWNINSVYRINWSNTNTAYGSKVDLYLIPLVACLAIYPTPSSCYPPSILLDRNIDTNTVYNWIAGTDMVNNPIPAGDYTVEICVAGTRNCDYSDQTFTLVSNLVRLCPSEKIINRMPSISPNNDPASTYFILNGTRRELSEFDLNWVSANCVVKEQVVY